MHHDKNNSFYLSAFLGHFCHIRTTGSYWQLPLTRALFLLGGDVFCRKGRGRFQKDQRASKSPKPRRSYCLGTTRLLQAWVEQVWERVRSLKGGVGSKATYQLNKSQIFFQKQNLKRLPPKP